MRKIYLEKIKNRFAQLYLSINLDVCVIQFDFKSCPRHPGEADVAVRASERGWLSSLLLPKLHEEAVREAGAPSGRCTSHPEHFLPDRPSSVTAGNTPVSSS